MGDCFAPLVRITRGDALKLVQQLLDELFDAPMRRSKPRREATDVMKGVGTTGMKECHILEKLKDATEDQKRYEPRQGATFALEALCTTLRRAAEPHAINTPLHSSQLSVTMPRTYVKPHKALQELRWRSFPVITIVGYWFQSLGIYATWSISFVGTSRPYTANDNWRAPQERATACAVIHVIAFSARHPPHCLTHRFPFCSLPPASSNTAASGAPAPSSP